MIYKTAKSSLLAAFLVLSATMMHSASARQEDKTHKIIHNWISPLVMVLSGGGIVYAWVKGKQVDPNLGIFTAMVLHLSVIANYFTRDKSYYTPQHYGLTIIPLLSLAIYLVLKILPTFLTQKAYFGIDTYFKLSKQQVSSGEQGLIGLGFVAGVVYFAMHVCWPLFFPPK